MIVVVHWALEMKGLDAVATFLLFSIVKSQNILQEELAARIEQYVQGTAYDITQCGSVHTQAQHFS